MENIDENCVTKLRLSEEIQLTRWKERMKINIPKMFQMSNIATDILSGALNLHSTVTSTGDDGAVNLLSVIIAQE